MNKTNLQPLIDEIIKNNFENELFELNKFFLENGLSIFKDVQKDINEIVYQMIVECVVDIYQSKREVYRKQGYNHTERINFFFKEMEETFFYDEFSAKYPVLINLINIRCLDFIEEIKEICTFFSEDYNLLTETFQIPLGEIRAIKRTDGDIHCGRNVMIVETTNCKLVYKPNSNSNFILFSSIIDLYNNTKEKNYLKYTKFVNEKDHFWQEYINLKTFSEYDSVKKYYYKCGIFLAIFLLFGTSDLHYENLIIHDDDPYFIDLETLCRAEVNNISESQKYRDIQSSVVISSMLPVIDRSSGFDINFSALFTGNMTSSKLQNYRLEEDEENDFIYKKYFASISNRASGNFYNGIEISPDEVKEYLLHGFNDGAEFILNNRSYILEILKDHKLKYAENRVILRATQIYAKFISAAKTPENLKSYISYNKIFSILERNFTAGKNGYSRCEDEIYNLKRGYIPYYYVNLGEKTLFSNNIKLENYLIKSPIDSIIDKMNIFDKSYIEYQNYLIKLSLSTWYKSNDYFVHNQVSKDIYDNNKIYEEIDNYFARLKNYIIEINESESNIPILEVAGNDLKIGLVNPGLYNGGGLVMLFLQYGKHNKCYENIARKILENIYSNYFQQKVNDSNIKDFGMFTGIGGLAYLEYNAYVLSDNIMHYHRFSEIITDIFNSIEKKDIVDLTYFSGLSGVIRFLNNCKLSEQLVKIKNKLENKLESQYLNDEGTMKSEYGLLHGELGILLEVLSISKNATVKLKAKKELALITSNLNKDNNKWCSGQFGLFCVISLLIGSGKIEQNYEKVLNEISNSLKKMENYTLCHGIASIIDCANNELIKQSLKRINYYTPSLLSPNVINWDNYNFRCNISFMLGESGYIYACLSRKYNNFPSVLLLDVNCIEAFDNSEILSSTISG